MEASRSLQRCARRACSQPTKQQLYIFSSPPRTGTLNPIRVLTPRTQHFSSTPNKFADSRKPVSKPNDFIQSLIRDTLAPEKQPPQPTNTASSTSNWAAVLSEARKSTSKPSRLSFASASNKPPNPTSTVNSVLNFLSDELSSPSSGPQISLRLRPTLGRTVDGLYGDPTRGFRTLERKCSENSVRLDARSQEKHIRRGQRRKNVRILRWRKLFMVGFKSELDTIQRMRRQGW